MNRKERPTKKELKSEEIMVLIFCQKDVGAI
jgi:hypothetical protein